MQNQPQDAKSMEFMAQIKRTNRRRAIRELALRRCKNSHFYLLFAQALALDGFDGGNPEEMHFFELLMRYLLGEVLNFFESQSRRSHQELRADPFHPLTPKPFIVVM